MSTYSGVVKTLGSGVVSGDGPERQVKREYIDIGEHHLRNIGLPQYLDDHLVEAQKIGGETVLSVWKVIGVHRVLAIKLPDGRVRKADSVVGSFFLLLFIAFLIAFLPALVLLFIFPVLAVLAFVGFVVVYPVWGISKFIAAKKAL